MSLDDLLRERLKVLSDRGLFREEKGIFERARAAAVALGLPLLEASGNDYLGLARGPVSRETWPPGAGASRLLGGTHPPHEELERALAQWHGLAGALLFSSGYAANLGVLGCLPLAGEVILSDALNHASIIDGCRLSGAAVQVFPHRDLDVIRRLLAAAPRPAWVVTETYFSMDGTSPDLSELRALCDAHGAFLIVDEAHALGVFGRGGRGQCDAAGIQPDVIVGAFGKAFGAQGGFAVGSATLRTYLWNRARPFVFSTATSPAMAATVLGHLKQVAAADEQRRRLALLCERFQASIERLGFHVPPQRHGPIFPILMGSAANAVRAQAELAALGVLAPAIRPPTVPEGQARLRITLTTAMSDSDVDRLSEALARLGERE